MATITAMKPSPDTRRLASITRAMSRLLPSTPSSGSRAISAVSAS